MCRKAEESSFCSFPFQLEITITAFKVIKTRNTFRKDRYPRK
ncbi:hypothetical protein [Clostridium botulinum]|nr:hypothetical protein [Clostridium botulinum]